MKMKPQLFFVHFAGGNRYSYRFLVQYLSDFEIIPLELPGRGMRMHEVLLTDKEMAASDLFEQIRTQVKSDRFYLFGHSMGSYLVLQRAGMLEDSGLPPSVIFVSGNAGPGIHIKTRYLLSSQDFKNELRALGGMDDRVLEEEELFSFYEPVLRADFELTEKYNLYKERPVQAPIFAMMGSREDNVGKIANWKKFTSSRFGYKIFEGGHFFIYEYPSEIANIIRRFAG
jgi:surfactin synthase thioesterase subunit